MAATATAAPAASHLTTIEGFAKGFWNALLTSRARAAARELRRHEPFIHETALIHGNLRSIGLTDADLLPFTA